MRLDAYIVHIKPTISRTRAKTLIESGSVTIDGMVQTKASFAVDESLEHSLEIAEDTIPYVSRGGLKLEGALDSFMVDPKGRVCADIGASTGGFTDCLLKRGAVRVYAVDSGSDQLVKSLKDDPRVVSLERFNARGLTPETFGEQVSLAVADLSFISQTYVLAPIASVLCEGGEYIGLIKPQFECGKSALGKNGIVKDVKQHAHAIKKVISSAEEAGFEIINVITSPIKGGDGNREFLFHGVKKSCPTTGRITDSQITNLVKGKE